VKRNNLLNCILILVIAVVSFSVYALFVCPILERVDSISKQILMSGIFCVFTVCVVGYFVFKRKLSDPVAIVFLGAAVTLALAGRLSFFDHVSTDYSMYLDIWTDALRDAEGVSGWVQNIGDYNMPYLYILTIIAKVFPVRLALYMTKLVSVFFDLVLAYYIMQISSMLKKNLNTQIAVYCAVLFVPTFVLNSSYWSQCDVIYSTFAVACIYYALSKRPNLAVITCALAFSFKLQTIFILPMGLVFLFCRKIKLKNLIWFPVVFLSLLVPALVAGKPFSDAISIYYRQAGQYPKLYINAPTVYQFFPDDVNFDLFKNAGILFTGILVLLFLFLLWKNKGILTTHRFLTACFIFALGIPFFLPCMHERYFYLADVFSIFIMLINPKRWFVPLGVIYSSFRAYTDFLLMCKKEDINFKFLTVIYLVILVVTVIDFFKDIKAKKANELNKCCKIN